MALKANPSQQFVPIREIRDGIAILNDNGMRAILMTSSINFALKSPENQDAIILQFQNFLNSLDFSLQIVVQSRRLDIKPYLILLEEQRKLQMNDLMKVQIEEYIEFIRSFTESTSIMTKSFFVVVPYTPTMQFTPKGGFFKPNETEGDETKKKETDTFEESRSQLEQRMSVVEQGLARCGLRVVRLGTEEATELFYRLFNPGENEKLIQQQ